MDIKRLASTEANSHFGGWEGVLLYTGAGGIPARAATTAGKATNVKLCMIENDGSINTLSSEFIVFNPFSTAVAANTYITAKVINGTQLVVDAEDCPAE